MTLNKFVLLNRNNYSFVIWFFLTILLSCSVNQNSISNTQRFTSENIMKIRSYMTSDEIASIFGSPRRTEAKTLGIMTGKPWQAVIWYYDTKYYSTKNFTFGQDGNQLILQYWEIK